MSDFELNTKQMTDTAERIKSLATRMMHHKNELDRMKNSLLESWVGEGRNEFEKQFFILFRQFTDVCDDTWTMYDNLVKAEQSYLQTDVAGAKQISKK